MGRFLQRKFLMGKKLFAQSLTKARQGAGLSREALAQAAGLSLPGLVKWERGERLPGSEELAKLCRALSAACQDFHAMILADDPPGAIPEGTRGRPKKATEPEAKPTTAAQPKTKKPKK